MPEEIAIVDVQPRGIACVHVRTVPSKWPSQFGEELGKVYDAIKTGHVPRGGKNVMVYRHCEGGEVDIDCGVEMDAKFGPVGEVMYGETPSGPAATQAHIGPYDKLGESHDAIVAWCRENGHSLAGICWEVYDHWRDDATPRTDIFHLLRQ